MCKSGPKFGYFHEPTKSWLIAKCNCFDKAVHIFKDTIQVATKGEKHHGAVFGKSQFRDEFIIEKINKWVEELHILSEIAKIEP